jgi:hypothetical protein
MNVGLGRECLRAGRVDSPRLDYGDQKLSREA